MFISGDGPQDRDANPGGASLFRVLADSLVAQGVAVLRHDDRGAGQSTRPDVPPSYRALLGDTRAAIAFVRARKELDAHRVFLVGHSEGAKTCEVLAAEDPGIAGIARIRCPVLILQGEDDRLVRPHHATEAAAALERGGNRRVTLRTFPGLTHGFTPAAGGTTAGTGVARTLAGWIVAAPR